MSNNPHNAPGFLKVPLTWSQFITWAAEVKGGPLCDCSEPTCAVSLPTTCPGCGGPMQIGIHVKAATLIVGCVPCERSMLYLKLEAGP